MPIAIVNNYKITEKEYKAELYQLLIERKIERASESLKKLAINNLIDACLLIKESQKYNFQVDEQQVQLCFQEIQSYYPSSEEFFQTMKKYFLTAEKLIEHIRNNLRIKRFIKLNFFEKAQIHNTQIKEYYQKHRNSFKTPEERRLCHILVCDENPYAFQKIDEISKRLFQNYDFYELAKDYSDCPSAAKGGDLGYFPRGKLVKELDDVVFRLPIGETAGPIKTIFGYHFIKLIGKRGPHIPEFNEIKDSLKRQLKKVMAELELLKFIRDLRSKARITIHYELL